MPGASKAGAKRETVSTIAGSFRDSSAAVLTEYRGLTVAQITELRRALGATTTYSVVKNTLTKIAASQAGVEGLEALLTGPTAVAFVAGDPVEAAKALRSFGREHPLLVVKGGVLDGKAISPAEIARLADLESREVLLAKLAGALSATTAKAAALFQAPLAQAARLAEALRAKAEADPSVLRGGAGSPVSAPADGPTAATDTLPPTETATASESPALTLTVDEAVAVSEGGAAPASNADAPGEADLTHGAGIDVPDEGPSTAAGTDAADTRAAPTEALSTDAGTDASTDA